jgi:osmotically-inducible protein OsmY
MGNLLVSLGGTRNADGTITDATGGTYSIQDGAWRPVAATTGTTTTGTTTTGTAPTAYDNFIASYAAKDVADFTAADYTALASSGYALSDIATSLNVTESSLAKALDRYSPENVAFQNFMDSLPATLSSAEDAQALLNSGYSLEKIASGYTNITASQLQAFIDGFDTPTTTGTTTTGTTTTGTTTTGTTTTDTTGADAVETLLNSTEQWMVANRGYVDNGDGTITDSTNGYVYDADTADTTASSLELFAQNNAGKTLTSEDLVALNNLSGEGYTAQEVIDTLGLKDADGNPISEAQLNSTLNRAVGTNTLNTIVADTDGLDGDQVSAIAGLITSNTFGISDVAELFDVPQEEVIAALLRRGDLTPTQIVDRYENLTSEADLMGILLSKNLTTPAEVAAYYNVPESEVRSYARSNYGLDLAGGGYLGYAQGGMTQGQGYYLGGTTDGMADQIPATIDNMQPAALSDGEFVIPADVVSHLGNGNSDAGAKNLYNMMDRVRTDRTGNPNQGRQIDPNKYLA